MAACAEALEGHATEGISCPIDGSITFRHNAVFRRPLLPIETVVLMRVKALLSGRKAHELRR